MRILLVTQSFHPFVGGIETHVRQIAHHFAHANHVEVAAVNFSPCRLPPSLHVLHGDMLAPRFSGYDDESVTVHALSPTNFERLRLAPIAVRATPRLRRYAYHQLTKFGYRSYRSVFVPKIRKLLKGMDIVHSLAGNYLGWATQEAARCLNIPCVCTPFVHPGQWGDDPGNIDFYGRCNAVISLLSSDRDYLASLGVPAKKLEVIGVSPDLPSSVNPIGFRARHALHDYPIVLYVGRMMPEKGARAILDAASLVWDVAPATRFVFIGPATVESTAWFNETDPRIVYLGKVSSQEKADAVAACDVFCMPSLTEILPTVYLEAWSLGKPVIGGMAPGLPELVEGNSAGIAANQRTPELAIALNRMLTDSKMRQRCGENGRRLVNERYSLPAISGALLKLYGRLLKPQKIGSPMGMAV